MRVIPKIRVVFFKQCLRLGERAHASCGVELDSCCQSDRRTRFFVSGNTVAVYSHAVCSRITSINPFTVPNVQV